MMVRTLPIRLAPLPGEALDSWLAALAHRCMVPARDILIATGMPTNIRGISRGGYTTRLLPDDARQIAAATGVPERDLHAMTLTLYNDQAVALFPHRRVVNRARLWAYGAGSRYCPACLAERGGRWLLRWRLTWAVACTRHRVLLAHQCPGCGGRPYAQPRRHALLAPHECATRLDRGNTRKSYCGTDLTLVEDLVHLDDANPVLEAQRWLDELLAGIERQDVRNSDVRSVFEDLTVLCAWLLRRARPGDFACYGQQIDQARGRFGTEWRNAPIDAAVAAGPLARAVEIYRGLGGPSSLAAIGTLLDRDAAVIKDAGVSVENRRQRRSDRLQQAVWQAADAGMDTCERLRYRTCTTNPRAPVSGAPAVFARARSIPPLLWRDWTILLMGRLGYRDARATRAALSVAVLLPGWDKRALQPLASMLHERQRIEISYFLYKISKTGGRDALATLCALADYLDEHPAPIDYHRRRTLDGVGLLPEHTWIEICCHADTGIGKLVRLQAVRRFLYQRITGVDLYRIDGPLGVRTRTGDALRLAAAPFLMSRPLLTALDTHAERYLQAHGIDEPVTWSPPLSLAARLDLPGRAELELDVADEIEEFYQRQISPSAAARELHTSLERMKLYFEAQPPDAPWPHPLMNNPTQNAKRVGGSRLHGQLSRQRADELLTAEFLQLERAANRKSIRTITRETGIPRRQVARRLSEEDLRERTQPRRAPSVDEAWLAEQYTVERRTIDDIAAEVGMAATTLRTRLLEAGIDLRPSYEGSKTPAHILAAAPPLIRPALTRRVGLAHLRALRLASQYPTLKQAADAHGTKASTLHSRIKALELDLGCKLYARAQRGTPLGLTPQGRAILLALAELERAIPQLASHER